MRIQRRSAETPLRREGLSAESRRRPTAVLALLLLLLGCGCRTMSYYAQAVNGQCSLLVHQRKVETILKDPQAPAELKARLELVDELLGFARGALQLPVDGNYRKYVDVHRQFVVWNVEASPEFSLEARSWWYPILGRQTYRGYFSEAAANQYARVLEGQGLDVTVGGVPAYSTLGWFKDPLLNTFVFEPREELAETIFHELAHQRLFVHGDTDFNEAFATAVGEEGARRWLRAKGDSAALEAYAASLRRTRAFTHLVAATRGRLADLYGDAQVKGGTWKATAKMKTVPRERLRREKQAILEAARGDYATLKARWGGNDEYNAWFAGPLNNAKLNSVATYYDLVPGFERMLAASGGDLERFFAAVEPLSKLPRDERHRRLGER